MVARLEKLGIVDPDGVVVVERATREPAPAPETALELTRTARYGDTSLDFFALRSR